MGRLSTALRAALAAGAAPIRVHEIDLPDSTALRSADGGFSAAGGRHYVARVVRWGEWTEGWSDDGVAAPRTDVVLADDADGSLETLIRGEWQEDFEAGLPTRLLVGAQGVAYADWLTLFEGVTTRPEVAAPREVRFGLSVDDRQVRTLTPRRAIGPAWPRCSPDAREQPIPLVYGQHDGGALGLDRGQIPTHVADETADVRLVAGGACKQVIRAWDDDGTIGTGDYTVATTQYAGWAQTRLAFSAPPAGAVTVDVAGVEEDGDGGGDLIINPAAQLAHYLSNVVFAQAVGAAWLATSPRIHAASLAAAVAWLAARAYGAEYASYYRGDRGEAYAVLREWQDSTGLRVWWQSDGTLAFGIWPLDSAPYSPSAVFRWGSDDLGGFRRSADDRDRVTGLMVRYTPSATGGYLNALQVRDPLAGDDALEELSLAWSQA